MDVSQPYNKQVFTNENASAVLFFACPYTTKISLFNFFIKRLIKDGFEVVAYDFHTNVFKKAELTRLPKLISLITDDIQATIKQYETQNLHEFGFFGSSLGSFIMYNVIAKVPQLNWGVFNTAGHVDVGVWAFPDLQKRYIQNGYQLKDLKKAWDSLNNPRFPPSLKDNYYTVLASSRDKVAPFAKVAASTQGLKQTGAHMTIKKIPPFSHNLSVTWGILTARKEIRAVRKAWQQKVE